MSVFWSCTVQATEIIRIQTPYTASHSGTPAMLLVLDTANSMQKEFNFVLEFRPGGNQVIAVKQMDQDPVNNLAIVAASFVDNVIKGQINAADYVPVWSLGDACWVVMSTVSKGSTVMGLRDSLELTVGTVGIGNATHLTALQIAKKYNLKVRLIPFKSNYDAVINMTGNNGVTFGIDTVTVFENLQSKNSKLRAIAVSCNKRLPEYPDIRTLREQGINAPSVINVVVSNVTMPPERRLKLSRILEQAADKVGERDIVKAGGFVPPQFNGVSSQDHFSRSMDLVKTLRENFKKEISQL